MTLRNPLVFIPGGNPNIQELPAGDTLGGAAAGTNGTNGMNGGAITIAYTFSTTTTDADPGSGNLRLDNATQNTATHIYADLNDVNGSDWTSVLDTFDASTNTNKADIRLVKVGDATKFLTFTLTARTTATGYRKFTLTNTGSSASSPFSDGDSILLCWSRAGDKGANGSNGTNGSSGALVFLEAHAASNSATLDFTAWQSSTYDEYVIELVELVPVTSAAIPQMRFSTNGGTSYDSGSNYAYGGFGYSSGGSAVGGSQAATAMNLMPTSGGVITGVANQGTFSGRVTLYTGSKFPRLTGLTSQISDSGFPAEGSVWSGCYLSATQVNALRVLFSSGNVSSGTVRVYGVSKS